VLEFQASLVVLLLECLGRLGEVEILLLSPIYLDHNQQDKSLEFLHRKMFEHHPYLHLLVLDFDYYLYETQHIQVY